MSRDGTDRRRLTERLIPSPVGALRLLADDDALCAVYFEREERPLPELRALDLVREGATPHPVLEQAARELREYFAGQRQTFTVPLRPSGTPFQLAVWKGLLEIPYGETRSYGEQARALGCPDAVRAVGAANGRNPISIIVPCHRVIGSSGALTGYGGGLPHKRWLLAHERPGAQLDLGRAVTASGRSRQPSPPRP